MFYLKLKFLVKATWLVMFIKYSAQLDCKKYSVIALLSSPFKLVRLWILIQTISIVSVQFNLYVIQKVNLKYSLVDTLCGLFSLIQLETNDKYQVAGTKSIENICKCKLRRLGMDIFIFHSIIAIILLIYFGQRKGLIK